MPRPRVATDEQVIAATLRIAGAVGPFRLTLADVAREVGVTPAALVQRFGSKRALLLAAVATGARRLDDGFGAAGAAHPDAPLAALLDALCAEARAFPSPREVAASLAFLQLDLTDADFLRITREHFVAFERGVAALLAEAEARRHAKRGARTLAPAVEVAFHGALVAWAIRAEGASGDAVRAAVRTLLEPFLTPRGRRSLDGSREAAALPRRPARGRAP